jgi:hypothetical protein
LGSSHQKGRVGIPLTGLTLQHFCACPKSEPGFPMSYAVFFLCTMSRGEQWLFVLLMLVELLTKTV